MALVVVLEVVLVEQEGHRVVAGGHERVVQVDRRHPLGVVREALGILAIADQEPAGGRGGAIAALALDGGRDAQALAADRQGIGRTQV